MAQPAPSNWHWHEYEDHFCRELSTCKRADAEWGWANSAPARTAEFGRYFLAHPEYNEIGRSMLLELTLDSFRGLLEERAPTPEEDALLTRIVRESIEDPVLVDDVSFWLKLESAPSDPNVLAPWLRARLPGWTPPPSRFQREGPSGV